jgi:hypothetical protein
MSTDDELARDLRAMADDSIPVLTVSTHRVVPRARRRRFVQRSAGVTGAVGALAVHGVTAIGGWSALPWPSTGAPIAGGGTPSSGPASTPGPVTQPTRLADPTATGFISPTPGTIADAQGHVYWYSQTEVWGTTQTESREEWQSLTLPGLIVWDGDLTPWTQDDPEGPAAIGPNSIAGYFNLTGHGNEDVTDASVLPTDPDALRDLLYASVEPDRRSGSDDNKVFGMIYDLLVNNPGLLPEDLRAAAWEVASGLPDVTTGTGTDQIGRTGLLLEYTGQDATTLVLDESTHLLLETRSPGYNATFVTQGPADRTPIEPTLEMSGCGSWESC